MRTKTMMRVLSLLLVGASGSALAAGGLSVEPIQGSTTAAGSFGFTIANDGPQALSGVRWYPVAGYGVQCQTQTAGGRGFAVDAELRAGDHATCTLSPAQAARPLQSAAVVVSANTAEGRTSVSHAGMSLLGGSGQAIVVVLGGAMHDDADLDGELDVGEAIAYDYTVVNAGTQALDGLAVSDLTGVVGCPATTLAVDAVMTCTSSYTVTTDDAAAGLVVDEVDVAGSGADDGAVVAAADVVLTINLAGTAGIRVFKSPRLQVDSDGSGYASEGDVLGYTFLVKNANAQTLTDVDLVEPDPGLIDGAIGCEATTLVAGQPFAGLGIDTLASQDVLRCTAEHTVTATDATAGEADNLVEATAEAAIGGPVWATGASATAIPGAAQLVVTKTVDVPTAAVGATVHYTITVSNPSSTDLPDVTISDPLPEGIDSFDWTCVGTGVTCPNASGSGAIEEAVPVFPAGASLSYTISAQISTAAPSTIVNEVTVTPPTNVVCAPGGTMPPCNATATLTTQAMPAVVDIPVDNRLALGLLIVLLGFMAAPCLPRRG